MESDAATATQAAPAVSSASAAAPSTTLLTADHLLAELPLAPPITDDADGRPQYLCTYSSLPITSSAAAFPEAVIRGRTPKDPTARLRGRFISYNAMLAWLVMRRNKMAPELYDFIKTWINTRAHEVNKQHGATVELIRAPPATWLQPDETGSVRCDEQEWVDAHKGPIFLAGDIAPAVDKAMRNAHMNDRQKKAVQRKAATESSAAADAAAKRVSRIGEPESDADEDAESSTLSKPLKVSAAASVTPAVTMDFDKVLEEMRARGFVFSQPGAPSAAPAPAAPKKQRAAPKKKPAAADEDKKEKKEKKKSDKKEKKEKKEEKKEKAARVIDDGDDDAAVAAPAAAAPAPAEPKKAAARKRSASSDEAEVKVPAGKRQAAVEVATRLPKGTRQMVYKLGQKGSGEVEATNFYSALSKAFVGSAKQFRAPEYVGILTVQRGQLKLQSLSSSAAVIVPDVEMADAVL